MSRFRFAERLGFEAPFEFENDIPEQDEVISQNKSGVIRVRNIVRFHNSDAKLSVLPPKGNNDLILYVNKKNDKPLLKGKVTRFKDSGITFYDIELVGLGLGKNLRKAVEENRQENTPIIVNDLMNWLGINDASHIETRAILHSWILEHIKEYPSDFVPDTPNGFDNLFELFQLCIELGVIDLSETAGYIADEVFAAFAKAIRDQKLKDHRWNPIPEDKYDPLFPDGSTIKEGILGALGAIGLDTIDNSGNPKVINTHTGENEYLRGINGLLVSELKQVILWFKNLILEAVTDAADLAGEAIKLYNAFIVGLINGLIDLLASLVDVLGFIIGLLNNDKQNTIIAAINKFIKEFGWDTIKAFIGKIFTNFIKFFDKESYEQAYNIGKLIPKIIEIAIDTYFFVKGGVKVVKKVADLAKDLPEILKQSGKALDDFVFIFTSIGFDKKLLQSLRKRGVELKIRLKPSQQLSSNPFKFFDGKEFKVEYRNVVLETFKDEKKAKDFLKKLEKDENLLENLFRKKRKLSVNAKNLLKKKADEALTLSSSKRPGVASVLDSKDKILTAYSRKGEGLKRGEIPKDLHPLVDDWLRNTASRTLKDRPTHGKCAEPTAISNWLHDLEIKNNKKIVSIIEARKEFEGVVSFAVDINKNKPTVHNRFKAACDSCNPLLDHFNIIEIFE